MARKRLGSQKYANLASALAPELWDKDEAYGMINGVRFDVVGQGGSRIALQAPDGIVYKVQMPTSVWSEYLDDYVWDQQPDELELFDALAERGIPWCPDYWEWRHDVVAMPYYRAVPYDVYLADYAKERKQMGLVNYDVFTSINCGLDKDGNIYLIDGGCSDPENVPELVQRVSEKDA